MKFNSQQIEEFNEAFEKKTPRDILQWTVDEFAPRAAISTAFGPEGLVIIDIARRKVNPPLPVFTIDTGFLFKETVELIRKVEQEYEFEIERLTPELTPEQQAEKYGPELFRREPDRCCEMRKVLPLRKKLADLDVLVTGVRRSQSESRQHTKILQLQETPDGYQYLKVSPLAGWTKEEVWWYIISRQLHYNPLHDEGYPSIGCTPDCCTRPVAANEDERAGRWAGRQKTECGLHTFAANI